MKNYGFIKQLTTMGNTVHFVQIVQHKINFALYGIILTKCIFKEDDAQRFVKHREMV